MTIFSASAATTCASGHRKNFILNTKNSRFSNNGSPPDNSADVTPTLEQWRDGDRDAALRLMLLVNQELRAGRPITSVGNALTTRLRQLLLFTKLT
jgi:hypothetical protein